MNMLVDGEWRTDAYEANEDETGEFERQETSFRRWIRADDVHRTKSDTAHRNPEDSEDDAEFPAEPNRYHLYISRACPWAHRTALLRRLKGLEDAVSMDIVDPFRLNDGWEFTPDKEGCTPDTVNGADYLREVYQKADPEFTGRVTVPVLWDRQKGTIVNNESEEVMRMFDTAFDEYATRDVTFYPEEYRDRIDEVIEEIYQPINNGVYRAGFAGSQEAYDDAVTDLFDALDRWDEVLADQRYLCGEVLTEADWCMFATLVRFDPVYNTHFKCNVRRVVDYPNLWNYLKELYRIPGVAETVDMAHIKEHYYRSHGSINPTRIVAKGPAMNLEEDHDRDRLPGGPPEALTAEPPQ